jgi:hypothetical protein
MIELQGIKQNPSLIEDDIRRIASSINQLVAAANRYYTEARVKSVSSNYTVDDTFTTLLVSSTAQRTLTLPNVIGVVDRIYTFIKTDSSTGAMKITGFSAGQTINGSTALLVTTQYGVRQITTDGIKWYRII